MSGNVSLIDGHIDEEVKKMTVKELIDYLYKCNMDYEVYIDGQGLDSSIIEEIKDITDEKQSRVVIYV